MEMKYNKEEHLIVEREELSANGRVYKRGKFYCITNGKTYDSLGGLRNAIRPMTIEAYYREFYMLESEGKCEMCGKATTFRNVIDGFPADEILNGKGIPRIPFEGNKSGYYRPDIFLPKINLLIEVKSDFTYAHTEKQRSTVHAKQKASIEAGFNHVIVAIKHSPLSDSDKACIKEFLDMAISSQARESGKVQRLSGDSEYRPFAIGSGSTRVPKK